MKPASSFAEVDLGGDIVIVDRQIVHKLSSYCRRSAGVALRADISRILIFAGSASDQM